MSSPALAPVRRHLTGKQVDTVQRLVDAAADEVADTGYDRLTVRGVARRAGVATATAYTYFASKDHLLSEVFARRVHALPPIRVDRRRGAPERVREAVEGIAQLVADEPELAAGVTTALLAHEPDVERLRNDVGAAFLDRLEQALGADSDDALLRGLVMALTGGLLMAGMGTLTYAELPARLAELTGLALRRSR